MQIACGGSKDLTIGHHVFHSYLTMLGKHRATGRTELGAVTLYIFILFLHILLLVFYSTDYSSAALYKSRP